MSTDTAAKSTEITNPRSYYTDDILAGVTSFADALALAGSLGVPNESMDDYGTGFKVLSTKDKTKLVGVDFIVLEFAFYPGNHGDEPFVSATIVTKHDEKLILNDGSTGIRDQLLNVAKQRAAKGHPKPHGPLAVLGGLTQTSYFFNANTKETSNKIPDGAKSSDWSPASTFYLA